MKKIAKLILFFTVSFVILFTGTALLELLSLWNEAVRSVPMPGDALADGLITAGQRAVPWALYLGMLLTLSYAARKGIGVPASVFFITLLAFLFTLGASLGMKQIKTVGLALAEPKAPGGEEGLLLSYPVSSAGRQRREGSPPETTVILLQKSGEIRGPRVISVSGKPLAYQESLPGSRDAAPSLPDLPFRSGSNGLFQSLSADFNLIAGIFNARLEEGFFPFCVYSGALILLLASLRFIFSLGYWPLANVFLGGLVFRGIAALEVFINAPEIKEFLSNFLGDLLPASYLIPGVFAAAALGILFYSFLVYLGWSGREQSV